MSNTDSSRPRGAIVTQKVEDLEFDCEPWRGSWEADDPHIQPVPGTWTLVPGKVRYEKGIKGLISCPKCSSVSMLTENMGETPESGITLETKIRDIRILQELVCNKCKFVCRATLKNWDTRKLYCAKYEVGKYIEDKFIVSGPIESVYMHAENYQDAVNQFWASHRPTNTRLIDTAPIIGLYCLDKDGSKLSVEAPKEKVKN